MNILILDDILKDPKTYVQEALNCPFIDFRDGGKVFKNIQPRANDELEKEVLRLFPNHFVKFNFIRKSPYNQIEPNFIHRDDMMGDVTVILYLNEEKPIEDGTTLYDEQAVTACIVRSKFNRMIAFDSYTLHSRNIYENFGEGEGSRLIQVIFLEEMP
jgi:hypothetical protein